MQKRAPKPENGRVHSLSRPICECFHVIALVKFYEFGLRGTWGPASKINPWTELFFSASNTSNCQGTIRRSYEN